MKKLILIALCSAAFAALADTPTVRVYKAPDGVNDIYETTDPTTGAKTYATTCVHVVNGGDFTAPTNAVLGGISEEDVLRGTASVVYGEGTNSSFITAKELTATQRRFAAMGWNLVRLLDYTRKLEARLAVLEKAEYERTAMREKAKAAREARQRKEDANLTDEQKVKRAIERAAKAKTLFGAKKGGR